MRRWLMLIPLAIFLAMAGFLYKGLFKGLRSLTRSYWGMQIAHLGIAVGALGVV